MQRLLFVLSIVGCGGCGGPSAEPVDPATLDRESAERAPTVGRTAVTPRAELPTTLAPLLPEHGVYAAGGGVVSPAWRVVVDTDANTIFAGTADQPATPSFGPLAKARTEALSARNKGLLMDLANDAWSEPPPASPPDPVADYDEVLIVLDGDETFYLEGYGPIRRPLAAKAIVELRAAAGLF